MRGRLIRLALLVLAFILLLSTLGSSVGVVELGVLGLLLVASGLVIMRPRRRDRGCLTSPGGTPTRLDAAPWSHPRSERRGAPRLCHRVHWRGARRRAP